MSALRTLTVASHGERLEAWWLPADVDDLTTAAGAPCVVMAHGFGCTRDCGLLPFAERFAAVGCHVLVFDYRGFGGSTGSPRQDVDHRRHREDYAAAVAAVRDRPDVDADRVVVWGTSYSGGHVVAVAARDHRLAAVVSQGAAMDGLAALTGRGRPPREPGPEAQAPPGAKGRALAAAVARDVGRAVLRRPPYLVAFMGPPGSTAMISGEGAVAFAALTGPSFRNQMCARGLLRIAANRPVRLASRVRSPTLLVIAERDEIAPARSVHQVAQSLRAVVGPACETVSYDCRHFDLYSDDLAAGGVFEASVAVQTEFLVRVLTPLG